jgi:hypothetical protein
VHAQVDFGPWHSRRDYVDRPRRVHLALPLVSGHARFQCILFVTSTVPPPDRPHTRTHPPTHSLAHAQAGLGKAATKYFQMAGIPPPSRSAAREAVIAAEAAAKSAKSKGKKKARPGANAKMPCVLEQPACEPSCGGGCEPVMVVVNM